MPVERKPLFRPDVLREHAASFQVPERRRPPSKSEYGFLFSIRAVLASLKQDANAL